MDLNDIAFPIKINKFDLDCLKNLPLDIIGLKYNIQCPYKFSEREDVDGICFYKDSKIKISGDLPVDRTIHILIHELLHALDYASGFKLLDKNEDKTELLSRFILTLLIHNNIIEIEV